MATTSEQRKQFADLRRSGASMEEAKAKAYGNIIPPAPTAPNGMPVAPTGGATLPIAPQVASATPSNPVTQNVTPPPVAPTPIAPIVEAPRDTTTGLSAPQVSVPTEVKPSPTIDPVQVEREKISAQNRATLEQNKQKAELERQNKAMDAQALIPTDQNSIVRTLISGASIPSQNTPEYRNAQYVYNEYKKYNAMTPTELATSLKDGKIGSELDGFLSQNPNYTLAKQEYDKFKKIDNINKNMKSVYGFMNGQEIVQKDPLQEISDKFIADNPDPTYANAFSQYVVNDPKIVDYTTQLSGINRQIADVSKKISDGMKALEAEKGDLPANAMIVLMNSTFKEANDTLSNLNNTKGYLQADLEMATNMAKSNFDAVSKDMQTQQALEAEKRQNQMQRENMVFQANLDVQKAQAEFEQKLEQQAQMANDPISGTNAIIDQFENMGIMADRSRQEIIADIQSQVASGVPLGQALTGLTEAFKSKPMYKAMVDAQMASLQPKSEVNKFTFSNLGDGVIAVQDPTTGNITFKSAKGATLGTDSDGNPVKATTSTKRGNELLDTPDNTIIPSRLAETTNPNNGKECGEFVNDVAGASLFGNTMEQKKSVAKETTGGIGKAIVWQPSQSETFKKYGHVGIIVGEEGDNWKVKSSNLRGDGAVTTDLVPKSASSNYKTLGNVKIESISTETPTYDENAVAIAEGYGTLSDLTATQKSNILPQLKKIIESKMTEDKDRNAIVKSALSNKEISDSTTQKMKDMQTVKFQLGQIENTLKDINVGPIMGILEGKNPWNTEAQVALAQLAGLTPKVARGIFGEVGVLTDTDITNYQKALPNLTSTEDKNKLIVDFMRKLLAEGYKQSIVTDAKANRNVAGFLQDYDEMDKYTKSQPITSNSEDESEWNDASNL